MKTKNSPRLEKLFEKWKKVKKAKSEGKVKNLKNMLCVGKVKRWNIRWKLLVNYLKTNFGEIMLGDNQHNLKKSKTTLTSATW